MKLGKKEWARWEEWIERVKSDLQATVNDRAVFHGFGDVVRANEEWIRAHHGGYFCDFVARSYVARSAIGVRRHVKRDDDSVSLVQILSQMKDCAPQLTFDFYLQQFPRNDADGFFWQKPTFKLVSENGVVASGQIIASDIEKLPFPMAPVGAQGVLALAEDADESKDSSTRWRWRTFSRPACTPWSAPATVRPC